MKKKGKINNKVITMIGLVTLIVTAIVILILNPQNEN